MYLIATVGVLLLALPALAHYPEDTTFKVFQFPDDHVPQMDGDAADWAKVPAEYFYDYTQYAELHRERGAPDTTDFYVRRSAVGWNKTHNRLYFMAEVYDDIWALPQGHHRLARHSPQPPDRCSRPRRGHLGNRSLTPTTAATRSSTSQIKQKHPTWNCATAAPIPRTTTSTSRRSTAITGTGCGARPCGPKRNAIRPWDGRARSSTFPRVLSSTNAI